MQSPIVHIARMRLLTIFVIATLAYGFATAAMLIPALFEFDVATGSALSETSPWTVGGASLLGVAVLLFVLVLLDWRSVRSAERVEQS